MCMCIRECEAEDAAQLASLMGQLGYPIEVEAMERNVVKFSSLPNQEVWVAEMGGEVVGCVAVTLTHYFHAERAFTRVLAMIVDEAARGKGVGQLLMPAAEAWAKENRCSHIEVTSGAHREELGAHAFYEKLGFVELSGHKKYFGKRL